MDKGKLERLRIARDYVNSISRLNDAMLTVLNLSKEIFKKEATVFLPDNTQPLLTKVSSDMNQLLDELVAENTVGLEDSDYYLYGLLENRGWYANDSYDGGYMTITFNWYLYQFEVEFPYEAHAKGYSFESFAELYEQIIKKNESELERL